MTPQDNKKSTLSRRQALKTIAAMTGAVTVTQLPSKWVSPVLTTGVLPAHAQTSPPINVVISNLQAEPLNANRPQGVTTFPVQFSFDYTDTSGTLTTGSTLTAQFSSVPAGILPTEFITPTDYEVGGDGSNGTLFFMVDFSLEQLKGFPESVTVTVQITNNNGNTSNQLQATYTNLFPEVDTLVISNLQAAPSLLEQPEGVTLVPVDFSVDYEDSAGTLLNGSTLNAFFISTPEGIDPTELTTTTEYTLSGDGFSGTLNFSVEFALFSGIPESMIVNLYLVNTNGVASNIVEEEYSELFPQ